MKVILVLLFLFFGITLFFLFRSGGRYARKAIPLKTVDLKEPKPGEEEEKKLPGAYVTKP